MSAIGWVFFCGIMLVLVLLFFAGDPRKKRNG